MSPPSSFPLQDRVSSSDAGQPEALPQLESAASARPEGLDRLARLGAQLAHAPMALVSLLDEDGHQRVAGAHGLPDSWLVGPIPLPPVEKTAPQAAPVVVTDAGLSSRIPHPPLVELGVAAYVAAPIAMPEGRVVGAFWLLDGAAHPWSDSAVELARVFARAAGAEIQAHPADGEARRAADAERHGDIRFRTVVEGLGTGLLVTDGDDVVLYANPAVQEITGYTPDQLIGRPAFEVFLPPEEHAAMRERNRHRLRGEPERYDCRMRHREGHWIDMRVIATPLRDGEGEIVGTLGALTDVTEQRRVQRALAESEERFRAVAESLGEGLLMTDGDDVVLYANPAMEQITGYAPDELIGRAAFEVFLPPEEHAAMRERNRRLLRGEPERYELRVRHREGHWIDMRVIATPLRDGEGEIVGTLGAHTDVTEQKRAEQALQESEQRFQRATRATNDVIWDWEIGVDRISWSEALGEVFGYSLQSNTSLEWWEERVHPEDRERVVLGIWNAVWGDGAVWGSEYRFQRADGTYAVVLDRGYISRDVEGRAVRMSGAIMDQTERKASEAALLEATQRSEQIADRMQAVAQAAAGVVAAPSLEHLQVVLRDACLRVLPLDAFLLALYDEERNTLEFLGGYDGDGYYPGETVPLEGRPSERVVRERRSVVTRSSADPASQGGLPWGKARRSESVIRTPVLAEGRVLGVVSIQSYTPDLYTADDVEVLETVAALAATAILNIRLLSERRAAEAALARSEQYFRSLTENALDLIHVINRDRTTRYLSPSVTRLLGYTAEELIGRNAEEMIHEDDVARVVEASRATRHSGDSRSLELRVRHADGSLRVFEATVRNLLDDPVVGAVVINSRDITERKRAEADSLRLAALSRENPNPVLECDGTGRPVHANPAAEEISRRLGAQSVEGILPPNHLQMVRAALQHGEAFQNVEVSIDGQIFSWTYRPHLDAGVVHLFAIDITGRRLMEEQLRHDALHDALTGLPNRLLFMERLAHVILRSKRREGHLFAVLFLDLDRFKVVNDSLGHHVGDELLGVVATRLQKCLRTEDTVARLGGDEFAILLETISGVSDATRVAERIQTELSEPVHLSGFDVFTSASIGIALSSSSYERPEYLLRNADMAMYRAKATGQARFEVFDRAMHAEALARLQLETDLRRALERGELRLAYQPVVDLATGRIEGVEALLRWAHPDRGWLFPDAFIPVAEETGLILPIGSWVLREACRRMAEWQARFGDAAPLTVGVNLSTKQFSQTDLLERISEVLRDTGLPARALRLEITESAVMENADTAVVLLERLKAIGVRISVDDFGTGYSSLSYLHRFPLDALKIDRSFVGRMLVEERSKQLVQTVLALARSLGVVAVAEGIETPEQLAELRELRAEYGQGYLFAKPLSPEDMEALLEGEPRW